MWVIIKRISFIILLFISIGILRRPIIPPELTDLTTYWWTEQQEVTEPDVYQFYQNGKVRIFNYNTEKLCNWSYVNGKLHIWKYSLFNPVNITFNDVVIERNDNGIYMYTDAETFYVHTELN